MLQPRILPVAVLFAFDDLLTEGSSATGAVLTLDTAADEIRKKTAVRVAKYPARLYSRDGKSSYYRRLEVHNSRVCLPLVCFFSPPLLSRYLYLLASSVQQSSTARDKYVFLCLLYYVSSQGST